MNTFELRLNSVPFQQIKQGKKTVEMRLFDEKRKLFNVGDMLIFKLRENENLTIKTQILALHKFADFEELYNNISKLKLGYEENAPASASDMEEYYSKDEQAKYGVVGIEIKVIN